jgi:hypothetical protein
MPEPAQIIFTYKEMAETLIKAQGIHEGIWGLFFRFGLNAANIGENDAALRPAAIIPVLEIGIQKMDKESNIAVDAAKVNPKPATLTTPATALKQ